MADLQPRYALEILVPRSLIRFTLPVLTLAAALGCQTPAGTTLDRLIIGEVMMNSRFQENLRALSVPGGRLTGTPNAAAAEEFVADQARRYGLKNVRFEPFDVPAWTCTSATVTVLDEPPMTLPGAIALHYTLGTPPAGVTAELYDVGAGAEEDFAQAGDSLRGKFVLVHSRGRRAAAELAVAHGAAGVVFLGNPDREPIIGQCYREPRPEPALAIRHADGQKLAARLAAGEVVRLNVQIEADTWDAQPRNVVAEIPGRGPWQHEVVIVSAHLDSWHLAEGAVDNASGSATILEVARALVATGWQPRRTVRFIWFMGEEQGLLGSYAYVDRHADQLDRVVAIVNADMPGSPRNFATSGSGRVRQALRDLAAELRGYAFTDEVPGLGGDWSDHAPFVHAGVCGIVVSGPVGDGAVHYHTTGDTFDAVDMQANHESAAVIAVLARRLADVRLPVSTGGGAPGR